MIVAVFNGKEYIPIITMGHENEHIIHRYYEYSIGCYCTNSTINAQPKKKLLSNSKY